MSIDAGINIEKNADTNPDKIVDSLKPIADILYTCIHNIIYNPSNEPPDTCILPEAFEKVVKILHELNDAVSETRRFARELSDGILNCALPPREYAISAPLKSLHASLRHLTWQAKRVAEGDYSQRIYFMGDFAEAFNDMIVQLEQRETVNLDEKTRLQGYMDLLLANCPTPFLLFNNEGQLAYVSDSYLSICNISRSGDIIGRPVGELFKPFVSEDFLRQIVVAFETSSIERRTIVIDQDIDFGAKGTPRHHEIQIAPMMDEDGNSKGVVIILHDTTEITLALEAAELASRSKSNFLATMSHEIRTPMNAITGMAELALREVDSPVVKEHIHTIKQAGSNLLSIINDILDFSKVETGSLEIITEEYLLSDLANDVVNIAKMRALESRLRFVVNIDSDIPNTLCGDEIRIRQIMLNLLGNAVKYTKKGFIALSVKGEMKDENEINLIIDVSDSGKGIKQEDLSRLFEEFTQFDTRNNRDVEGTGLGLAITKKLVEAMNGEIYVQSEYGKGSTFTVILPQRKRPGSQLAIVNDPRDKHVLIFERREICINSVTRTMEDLGVNYKLVKDASDFYKEIMSNKYSFVILASVLYENVRKTYLEFKSNARFVLLAEYGESIAYQDVSVLTTPVYCTPIANFLNGVADSYTRYIDYGNTIRFTAPDAKVLVVDDINTNLKVAEGLLLPYEMQTDLCSSGMEAIKAVRSETYDLVLMDHLMPNMDGIETVLQIRALESENPDYFKNLPIIALTANVVFGTKEIFLEKGFNDFLPKPIDMVKMNSILERWIPREKQKKPAYDAPGNTTIARRDANDDDVVKVEGLDVKKGIRMLGGDTKQYIKLLAVFYHDGFERIREIKTCLEMEDITLFVIHVHALKSSIAALGGDELSKAAGALESAGQQRDFAFIETGSVAFLEDLEILLNNIGAILAERNAYAVDEGAVDVQLLKNCLVELKTAMSDLNSPAINNAATSLEGFTQVTASDIGYTVNRILQNRTIGQYEGATSLIDALLEKLHLPESSSP